nr:DUF2271 domain-containing protein [Parahaliea mediterranea]
MLCCQLVLGAVATAASAEQAVEFHRDGVLGTSLDLTLYGADRASAEAVFDRLQTEWRRLEAVLSTYRDDSELSRLNRAGGADRVSADLRAVLEHCERWRRRSAGRFSCRMGKVEARWRDAERRQSVPDRIELRALAWNANRAGMRIDGVPLQLPGTVAIAADGLAKGYVIDRLAALLRDALPGVAFKLDIGGDAVYAGAPPGRGGWEVAVADPVATADNGGFVARLRLNSRAIAASGHHSRSRNIGRREFSHILTPRDGWPVVGAPAAVVVAPDAVTADAVATALAAGEMAEGIDWVDGLAEVEALLIDGEGRQLASANWHALLDAAGSGDSAEPVLRLAYTLPEMRVAEFHSPYVAIWISDSGRRAVKNLLLLGETERWARENRRWWRRVGRKDAQLLDGIARPTRQPGHYELVWDGRDDFGRPVAAGDYTLHLEASREAGGSTYRQIPFVLGDGADDMEFAPEGEIGRIHLWIAGGR